ncbi:hypothetical protein P4G95_26990 [Burkholderia vietnamiensis]|jgi:hypothetical protein|uniref:hypothetical protein n=1 Tax=Burkholderia TaxID=32008 RepID=UPI000A588603|nr:MULTISPECIES: hypothetical protein [Burkholderia]MDN8068430.1 hypothetical protein [Burkholderia vietnamiensis]UEB99539.1 hypothetical protein LK462_01910 [Burkholderia vietnamiensis]WHU96371.1 hypothetical protein P4G95_26990 [Burkholderia vietnamiensis]HDR9052583.1 hypothetical protein [Burkholderia vietnamiensis]HDR9148748.1 hypothetical protein [Burkholderia vietnamiensis]
MYQDFTLFAGNLKQESDSMCSILIGKMVREAHARLECIGAAGVVREVVSEGS